MRRLILHRMMPRNVDDVPTIGIQTNIFLREHLVSGRTVTIDLNPILDDLDPRTCETIYLAQPHRAEIGTRGHRIRESIKHESVHGAAHGRYAIGIVPAVLVEDEFGTKPAERLRERRVEEWGVL